MTDFLIYDLKVAALIAVFYMFYRLLLSRETFHRLNRMVLLTTAAASFVLPLCIITLHKTVLMPMPEVTDTMETVMVEVAEEPTPWWQIVLPVVFFAGMAATVGHTLTSVAKVILLIRRSEKYPQEDGTMVCVTPTCSPPCNGSTPLCGCCVPTCAPFTSTRPTGQCSLKASMHININICLLPRPRALAGTPLPTASVTVP